MHLLLVLIELKERLPPWLTVIAIHSETGSECVRQITNSNSVAVTVSVTAVSLSATPSH